MGPSSDGGSRGLGADVYERGQVAEEQEEPYWTHNRREKRAKHKAERREANRG